MALQLRKMNMLRILSEEIAVNLKDRLREVRYMIRRNRHESLQVEQSATRPGEIVSPELLLGHAASVMDKALTTAETISISALVRRAHALFVRICITSQKTCSVVISCRTC
jgi:hypothetical protein